MPYTEEKMDQQTMAWQKIRTKRGLENQSSSQLTFYQESMERSGSVNLRELAQKLTTLIGDKLSYIITDDTQYHNNVIRDEKNEYVAGVLTLERPFVSANGYYRENSYSILFHIRQENKMDFISDLSNFINSETTEIIDDNYVQKIYQTPVYQKGRNTKWY